MRHCIRTVYIVVSVYTACYLYVYAYSDLTCIRLANAYLLLWHVCVCIICQTFFFVSLLFVCYFGVDDVVVVWLRFLAQKCCWCVHLRVLYRRGRDDCIDLDEQIFWIVSKALFTSGNGQRPKRLNFVLYSSLFCFFFVCLLDIIYLRDLSFYGPPTVEWEWHSVARTHLYEFVLDMRGGRKGCLSFFFFSPFFLFFFIFFSLDRTPFITVPFTAQRSHKAFMYSGICVAHDGS